MLAKPRLDLLSAIAAVASATDAVDLGRAVYLPTLQDPEHVAYLAATVDQLSGGRLELSIGVGIGAGVESEYANLGLDFVHRERSVDDARGKYATTALKEMMGGDPDYTQDLQFTVPTGDQGNPDETIVTDAMKSRIKEKLGDDAEVAGNE